MKKQGIIIANTQDRARRFAENNLSVGQIKMNRDELETNDCIYKFKPFTSDILRGYRDIDECYIQYDIPVGAYFETISPYLSHDCKIRTFD